jgi:hypothetical protein
MNITTKQLRQYLQMLKFLETELHAYREFYQYALDSRPSYERPEMTKEFLRLIRIAQGEMNAKYDDVLESLDDESVPSVSDQALKFLAEWKTKGRPN